MMNTAPCIGRLILLIAIALMFMSPPSNASELELNWAGLSFLGKPSDASVLYKHSFRLSQEKSGDSKSVGILDARLREIVFAANPPNYSFRPSDSNLLDLGEGQGLVMALVVDREDIAREKIRDDYKLVIDLAAQILVFDYTEKKVIAAFPVATQLIDVVEGAEPTDQYVAELIRGLYLGNSGISVNLLQDFADALERQHVKRKYNKRVMVHPVEFTPEVTALFPPEMATRTDMLGSSFGRLFAKHLSVNQLVSILPAKTGTAIGGKMALQFASGAAVNLTLPPSHYDIEIRLTGLKRVLYDEKPSASTWIYGALIEVTAKSDLASFLDSTSFKQGLSKTIPATQTGSADWPVYWEVINELADGLTMQMRKKPDKGWLKTHAANNPKKARKGLKAFAKKLEGCK